jgi:hypothetical protein
MPVQVIYMRVGAVDVYAEVWLYFESGEVFAYPGDKCTIFCKA